MTTDTLNGANKNLCRVGILLPPPPHSAGSQNLTENFTYVLKVTRTSQGEDDNYQIEVSSERVADAPLIPKP